MLTIIAGLMILGTVMSVVGYFMQRQRMKKRTTTERTTKSIIGVILVLTGFVISIPAGVYYWLSQNT